MVCYNPAVRVRREKHRYGGSLEGTGDLTNYNEKILFSVEIEGTAVVEIEMRGWKFINAAAKTSFEEEIENFKLRHKHGPDNFNDEDREEIKKFVECLLHKYYYERKIVPVK